MTKKTNSPKKKKKETKDEKEKREKKEIENLEKELKEVSTEIKKVALNNKKLILDKWEIEKSLNLDSKGLTSPDSGLDFSDAKSSLELINPPMKRLVPLERTLEVNTSTPNPFGNNNSNLANQEFNPFKYNSTSQENDSGPKYTNYAASIPGAKRIDLQDPSINLSKRKEMDFNPMYNPESNHEDGGIIFNPVKRRDISELGMNSEKKKEVKYTPSGY